MNRTLRSTKNGIACTGMESKKRRTLSKTFINANYILGCINLYSFKTHLCFAFNICEYISCVNVWLRKVSSLPSIFLLILESCLRPSKAKSIICDWNIFFLYEKRNEKMKYKDTEWIRTSRKREIIDGLMVNTNFR